MLAQSQSSVRNAFRVSVWARKLYRTRSCSSSSWFELKLANRQLFHKSFASISSSHRNHGKDGEISTQILKHNSDIKPLTTPSRRFSISNSNSDARSALAEVAIPEIPITEFVFRDFKRCGDRPALINGLTGEPFSFPKVHDLICRVASGLSRHGVRKGDVVMIVSENCVEYVIVFHAILSLGATVTPVNPQYLPTDIASQAKDSSTTFLVTSKKYAAKSMEVNILTQGRIKKAFVFGEESGFVPYDVLTSDDGSAFPVNVDINPRHHVAILPYSSGTTGLPKGVMLSHFAEVANTLQSDSSALFPKREGIVQLGMLPFYHIYAIMANLISSLAWGQTSVIIPGFEPKLLLTTIAQYKVNMMYAVPPIILFLNRHPIALQAALPSLQRIISAAAPLGKEAIEEFHAKRPNCLLGQAYGLTETGPGVSVNPIWSSITHPSSSGTALTMTEIKIVNSKTGAECEVEEHGEICVRGPQLMLGYLNNRRATEDMIDDQGWLKTGDIGYLDKDSYLYLSDRMKELIKYKGLQVAPAELEAIICSHPNVEDAGVIGFPDAEAGELPKAFVALKKGANVKPEEIQKYVSDRVVGFKKLRGGVEFISQIPRSAAGKILRRELKAMMNK